MKYMHQLTTVFSDDFQMQVDLKVRSARNFREWTIDIILGS